MEAYTLDDILESDSSASVILSNSGFIIIWFGGDLFEVWCRVPNSDTTFFFSDCFLGQTFKESEVARAVATDYALKTLPTRKA